MGGAQHKPLKGAAGIQLLPRGREKAGGEKAGFRVGGMLAGHWGHSASGHPHPIPGLHPAPCTGAAPGCAHPAQRGAVGRTSSFFFFPSPSANKNLGAALAVGNLNFPQTGKLVSRLEKKRRKFLSFPKSESPRLM